MSIKKHISGFYDWALSYRTPDWIGFCVFVGSFVGGVALLVLGGWLFFGVLPIQFTFGLIVFLIGLLYYNVFQHYKKRTTKSLKEESRYWDHLGDINY